MIPKLPFTVKKAIFSESIHKRASDRAQNECVEKGRNMKAQDYLKQLKMIDVMINNKIAEREHWFSIACNTTAQYGGERVQTSGSKQRMADAIDKFVDMGEEINRKIDELCNKRKEIVETIEQLKSVTEYDLLFMVYVQYKTLQDVADKHDRSYSWATSAHGTALAHVQEILDERAKKNDGRTA